MVPAALDTEVESIYYAVCIGRVDELKERFYAISVERRVLHPVVAAIMETARESLFSENKK